MATVLRQPVVDRPFDHLVGTPRAQALDRWIFTLTAGLYIVITLVGFIPDSLQKLEMVRTGQRAPFPPILHFHAILMGSFLLTLFAQTWLVANGRTDLHRRIGPAAGVLAGALVAVGFLLAPTMYHQTHDFVRAAPPAVQTAMAPRLLMLDNILLFQIRIGVLFALFIALGLHARGRYDGFHKRMMILAPAAALPAAFDRMEWLPSTLPGSPLSADLYPLLAIAPMFAWDVIRNHRVHESWLVFAAAYLPACVLTHWAWDQPWWHSAARSLMGI